jgi:hypothetical protein
MSEDEQRLRRLEEERRLRQVAVTRATHQPPEPVENNATPSAETRDEDDDAPAQRMEQKALWVDLQVRRAMERGEFDNLPGTGKPIRGLDGTHDPDWWVKRLIEREQITGVLPPALGLRREDAELDAVIDREGTEEGVRRVVEDFNRRVVDARRQLLGGPPVVTATRDVDQEVAAWRARLADRRRRQREQLQEAAGEPPAPRRGFRRRFRRSG